MNVGFVTDEIDYLGLLVPLRGARVLEVGCGEGVFSRKLLARSLVASITALEADEAIHDRNVSGGPLSGLTFLRARAESIPELGESFDLAVMLKSMHHIPVRLMDLALTEISRVLTPGGHLYVSEPVSAGPFNEIMRLFHDEKEERAAAYAAIRRAGNSGMWEPEREEVFRVALEFRDFADFLQRMVYGAGLAIPNSVEPEVRRRFESVATPSGVRFVREMRINLLRKRLASSA